MTAEHVAETLGVSVADGLTSAEAASRLAEYGPNDLEGGPERSLAAMVVGQFNDVLVWVLLAATVVSFLMGDRVDAVVIMAIVVLNAVLGVAQEYRAEQSLAALKDMSAPLARVRRDGRVVEIPAREVAPGDILLLEAGSVVAADARVVEAASLLADESLLTGEAEPVEQSPSPVEDEDAPLGDRTSILFSGSAVTNGRGVAIVVGTGADTEVGRIAAMLNQVQPEQTPLQRKLEGLGRWLAVAVLAICAVVFVVGLLRRENPGVMFLTAVSLAVGAIPEGLPAVVTIVLAVGMRNMVHRHVLIRRLQAVETLGATTVICTDKTGTLTRNEMTVRRWWTRSAEGEVSGHGYAPTGEFRMDGAPLDPRTRLDLDLLLHACVLCNDAHLREEEDGWHAVGDPTEAALLAAAGKAGWNRTEAERFRPRIAELPFDSGRKRMTTVHSADGAFVAVVKGAPDELIKLCTHIQNADRAEPLDAAGREAAAAAGRAMASDALRVLGFAIRRMASVPERLTPDEVESGLTFVGLVGMMDPPRAEAASAIQRCLDAGIRPVMITGDYPATAAAIAGEIGLAHGRVLSGRELGAMPPNELAAGVADVSVFARVSPEDKLRIVHALKAGGEVVAMTGDGVNDAPALKRADIGVAMGQTGTDVAKGASDMVLTDDNFSSIVAAVEEGRTVFANIRKAVYYLLSCNVSEVLSLFLALVVGWHPPLIPVQILWVNLVTDGLPALALGMEPAEPGLMSQPPRNPREGVLDRATLRDIVWYGLFITAAVLLAFWYTMDRHPGEVGLVYARTAAFLTISFAQLAHAFNCRSPRRGILQVNALSNWRLLVGVAISAAIQLAAVYVPWLQKIFSTVSLSGPDLVAVVLLSASPLVFGEARKAYLRHVERVPSRVH
jgi:Ca2+-transporting ATPase